MTNEFYCKQITASFQNRPDQTFFIFTRFFPSPSDNDIESGTLTVEVTNGSDFWRSKDNISAEDLSSAKGSGRIHPALEALTDKFINRTRQFTYALDTRDQIYLVIHFTSGTTSARSRLRILLHADPNPQPAIALAINCLLNNLKRLRRASVRLAADRQALEIAAADAHALVQHHTAFVRESETALFEGVTALLNAKKAQIRAAAGREEKKDVAVEEIEISDEEFQTAQEQEEEEEAGTEMTNEGGETMEVENNIGGVDNRGWSPERYNDDNGY